LPGWSGREHQAIVVGVNPVSELISLKVSGPIDLPTGGRDVPYFNFSFPVRTDWADSLWRTVVTLGESPLGLNQEAGFPVTLTQPSMSHPKSWAKRMLFPSSEDGAEQTKLNNGYPKRRFWDTSLNFEQAKAVDSIQKRDYGTVPFLISGPPGTGKTKTVVETALQLCQTSNMQHILMCAPSDPAADTLAQRLRKYFTPKELLRLNSPSRTFAEVPMDLMPYCYLDTTYFSLPPFETMMQMKIIVVTCRDADMLVKARLTNVDLYSLETKLCSILHSRPGNFLSASLHWEALLMDEAGQAIEPEALIPLTVVSPPFSPSHLPKPQFVMAGDHKQLGPRTASRSTLLQKSLFERLLDFPFYAEHPLARQRIGRVTKITQLTKEMLPMKRPAFANLIRNYRSHPAILAIPNNLFYYDTLLTEAPDINSLLSLSIWRGRRWPVLFSCNTGQDEVQRDGGGWFNVEECEQACQLTQEVLSSRLIRQEDICVMSPFMSQVRHLRIVFRAANLHAVNIGPMEAFQGLESRFVILCTTRSRDRFLDQDTARGLGIINEPKRLNVALTRAKQGLVVIGNPELLNKDPFWKTFLNFCSRNGLWDSTRIKLSAHGKVKDRKLWNGELEMENKNQTQSKKLIEQLPALELMLQREEEGPSTRQLGEVAAYDDAMWVNGMTEDLPTLDDLESAGGELKQQADTASEVDDDVFETHDGSEEES
jgi:helicase MOV-10